MTRWIDLPLWMKIGYRIRDLRKWREMSQEEVALEIGLDLKTYKMVEKGETKSLTLEEVFKLKETFGVVIEEIIPL